MSLLGRRLTSRIMMSSRYTRQPLATRGLTTTSHPPKHPPCLQIHQTIQEALSRDNPVVALESTIIAHGMPFPENLNLSKRVASILRSKGVEPATIAVKDGICRVGLSPEEIEDLARAGEEGRAQKASTRELPLIMAKHSIMLDDSSKHQAPQWGATTVASTMKLAHAAGITTFVTGGIGGVHRHAEVSMDVSADLTELSRIPVIVVSAGIKSILDIGRTLEVLETNGVPTVAYQTDEFPAFFSPRSGVAAPARVDDADQVSAAYWAARDLNLSHGMLVAVPNSDPAGANVEDAIQAALAEADEQGIHGQAVTPFILKRVAEKTGGDSLRSNMALVERNAAVGADIAIAIANRIRQRTKGGSIEDEGANVPSSRVVVMGGCVLDIAAKPETGRELILGTSNPSSCIESDGGVGRNVAEVLGRLGSHPLFYSAVGNDARGLALLDRLREDCGVLSPESTVTVVDGANTATYLAVLNGKGNLHTACADMSVLAQIRAPAKQVLDQADALVLDANPALKMLHETALQACRSGTKIFFEPTSVPKALEVSRDETFMSCLSYAFPNLDELSAMADGWTSTPEDLFSLQHGDVQGDGDELALVKQLSTDVLDRMHPDGAYLLITMGENGVLLASKEREEVTFQHFPAEKGVVVLNATGAGDSLCGAFIHAILDGKAVDEAVSIGMEAAMISLQCSEKTVSPQVSDL